jgi:hypothetical protein
MKSSKTFFVPIHLCRVSNFKLPEMLTPMTRDGRLFNRVTIPFSHQSVTRITIQRTRDHQPDEKRKEKLQKT